MLSVANWGGISLHLRGNVEGYNWVGSRQKWLRIITGRHDLPFYYTRQVELQRSFLDAFLKGNDWAGWDSGKMPKVSLTIRRGDKGVDNANAEREWEMRVENEWPLARTDYQKWFLTPSQALTLTAPEDSVLLSYRALGTLSNPELVQFRTAPFEAETEITGHVTAHLNVSMTADSTSEESKDIDIFVTLRHLSPSGKEIYYTGAAGDPVPLSKGWLRLSLRKVDETHPQHRHYLPRRNYCSVDMLPVQPGTIYPVDVEIWPTNVVMEKGHLLVFEVSSGDTQGSGIFRHDDPLDRAPNTFAGQNHIHFSPQTLNFVVLPVIPAKMENSSSPEV